MNMFKAQKPAMITMRWITRRHGVKRTRSGVRCRMRNGASSAFTAWARRSSPPASSGPSRSKEGVMNTNKKNFCKTIPDHICKVILDGIYKVIPGAFIRHSGLDPEPSLTRSLAFLLFFPFFFLASCSTFGDRDNPADPGASNYAGRIGGASSASVSAGSVTASSASVSAGSVTASSASVSAGSVTASSASVSAGSVTASSASVSAGSVTASSASVSAGSVTASSASVSAGSVTTGTLTDSRDGQIYKTVVIGMQTWMAQNLNYAVDSSWCYWNSADSCSKYGRLYQWAAAMGEGTSYNSAIFGDSVNHQGVCPAGWHVPTIGEWNALATAVGDSGTAGTKLKSTAGWNSSGNGTDDFGFSAFPAGSRYYDGARHDDGLLAIFWSATEIDANDAYYRALHYDGAFMDMYYVNKFYAFSVRCVQD